MPLPPQTATFRSVAGVAAVAVAAGAAATGGAATTSGAVATYYHHNPAGTVYALAASDRADPLHFDPSGEWIRIESAPTMGTAAIMHLVLGPGD